MPSDLQRIAQGLVECLDQVPQIVAHLQQTAMRLRQQASWIADLSGGSPYGRHAALLLHDAAQRCDEAAYRASLAPPLARTWAEQMVAGVRTATGPSQSIGRSGSRGLTSAAGDKADAASGDANAQNFIRRRLPQRKGIYDKTHGVWIDSEGEEHTLVSGYDDYRSKAEELRIERQFRPTTATSHVEIKFAMQMRERGLRDETIYLNNKPCEGPESCTRYLPDFLPEGARLTIHWPGGKPLRYEGRGPT